jgi:hypothetical protein
MLPDKDHWLTRAVCHRCAEWAAHIQWQNALKRPTERFLPVWWNPTVAWWNPIVASNWVASE